jgi:hypothetical protein
MMLGGDFLHFSLSGKSLGKHGLWVNMYRSGPQRELKTENVKVICGISSFKGYTVNLFLASAKDKNPYWTYLRVSLS